MKDKSFVFSAKGMDINMNNSAYIALGSNMGERAENINRAVQAIAALPMTAVVKASNIYETAPLGYSSQADFYNAVIQVETEFSPEALLGACLGIEAAMGRVREFVNGPRMIDLDLLIFGEETRDTKELILPHPRMRERSFVLVPLCDVLDSEEYKGLLNKLGREGVMQVNERISGF